MVVVEERKTSECVVRLGWGALTWPSWTGSVSWLALENGPTTDVVHKGLFSVFRKTERDRLKIVFFRFCAFPPEGGGSTALSLDPSIMSRPRAASSGRAADGGVARETYWSSITGFTPSLLPCCHVVPKGPGKAVSLGVFVRSSWRSARRGEGRKFNQGLFAWGVEVSIKIDRAHD